MNDAEAGLYRTVSEGSPEKLDAEVSSALRQGWLLYGNPYAVHWKEESGGTTVNSAVLYSQGLVRQGVGR